MTITTDHTNETGTDPLAALTVPERHALAGLARDRAAFLEAHAAAEKRHARMDAFYQERALAQGREAEERATALQAAEKAAEELTARPLRRGDDALSVVREAVPVLETLGSGHHAYGPLAARISRLAVVAVASGASELSAMEALGVRDRRGWEELKYSHASAASHPEFAGFLNAAENAEAAPSA